MAARRGEIGIALAVLFGLFGLSKLLGGGPSDLTDATKPTQTAQLAHPAKSDERSVSLGLFQFRNFDGDGVASFVIMNSGDRAILLVSLECSFFEPLLKNVVPLPTVKVGPVMPHQVANSVLSHLEA